MTGSEPLRVGMVHEHFTLPWRLAAEAGDAPIEIVEQPGGTGQMRDSLQTGDVDLALMLTEGAIAAIANGLPAAMTRVYQASPLFWGIYAAGPDDRPLDDMTEDGVRFAISRYGSGSHLMAFVLAEAMEWRLSPESFVVAGSLEGAREVLAGDTADLFLWDRYMTSPLVESGEFRFVGEQPTPWPALVVVAHESALAERGDEVEALLDTIDDAAIRFLARPDRVELVVDRFAISADQAVEWFRQVDLQCREVVSDALHTDVAETLTSVGAM